MFRRKHYGKSREIIKKHLYMTSRICMLLISDTSAITHFSSGVTKSSLNNETLEKNSNEIIYWNLVIPFLLSSSKRMRVNTFFPAGVNFINILHGLFLPIFWCQKISNPKHSFEYFCAKILLKKLACKMLMKFTPVGGHFHQHFTCAFFI